MKILWFINNSSSACASIKNVSTEKPARKWQMEEERANRALARDMLNNSNGNNIFASNAPFFILEAQFLCAAHIARVVLVCLGCAGVSELCWCVWIAQMCLDCVGPLVSSGRKPRSSIQRGAKSTRALDRYCVADDKSS